MSNHFHLVARYDPHALRLRRLGAFPALLVLPVAPGDVSAPGIAPGYASKVLAGVREAVLQCLNQSSRNADIRKALALALLSALAGCAGTPETEPDMTDDASKELADALAKVEAVSRDRDAQIARMEAITKGMEAVSEELPELTMPKLKAVQWSQYASPEERRDQVSRIFIETLRQLQDDQQRDPGYREAARMLEQRLTETPGSGS